VRVNEQGEIIDSGTVAQYSTSLDGDIFATLLRGGFFPPHTVMLPRAVLERVGGFDQTVAPCEDYDLWLRLTAQNYRVKFLNESLAYYRFHAASATQNHEHWQAQQRAVLKKIVAQFPERVAQALYELGAQFNSMNGALAANHTRESQQRDWIQQLERDKTTLQNAADAREHYLQSLEANSLFRVLVELGLFPRRRESNL
jgi:hypothetical protein